MPRPRLRILLVENHPDTREGLETFFDLSGDHIVSARDFATAVAMARGEKFDVLISDIDLPDGDGWELMRHLRAQGFVPAGVAMSGFGRSADKERSSDAGYAAHLVKPFTPDKLEAVLQKLAAN